MMEDLTAQKVNKWLFWIIIASFVLVTYLNFRTLFHQTIEILLMLPFWFLLTAALLVTFLILHFINLGERQINELELELSNQQIQLMEMERKFRLIKQDVNQITSGGFKYYCADVLKAMNYQEVKVLLEKNAMDIEAINEEGEVIYVKCIPISSGSSRDQIHQLYYQMLQDGIKKGIVLTNVPFSEEEENWAATFNIRYLYGKKINQIVQGLIDVDMSCFFD